MRKPRSVIRMPSGQIGHVQESLGDVYLIIPWNSGHAMLAYKSHVEHLYYEWVEAEQED